MSASRLNLKTLCTVIGVIYGDKGYWTTGTPTFWTWGTVPPLFRTQVKNLLSTKVICGDKISYGTLKLFSAGAPPWTPIWELMTLHYIP